MHQQCRDTQLLDVQTDTIVVQWFSDIAYVAKNVVVDNFIDANADPMR